MDQINQKILKEVRENPRVRKRVAFESPLWFSLHYLGHHFTHPLAPFHIEMFHLLTMPFSLIAIMAFRESGKSTIMSTANVLWSILGKPQKKLVLIISETQEQAKSHFTNIKSELEHNELLRVDFGPFMEHKNEWNKLSLELEYHGAKIVSVTREQSVRGMRYGQHRPDLIVCDDLEDSSRIAGEGDEIYRRFENEIIPLGGDNTHIIVLGNLISEHSFLMQLGADIQDRRIRGIFRAYPFIDDEGRAMWPGKYPTIEDIARIRERTSEQSWKQEYLLKVSSGVDYRQSRNANSFYDNALEKYGPILRELRLAYHRELERVGTSSIFQAPLVPPMNEYRIMLPNTHIKEPCEGDPDYNLFENYQKALKKVANEYRNDRVVWWHRRIDSMP